jgi:hypothetical protein
MDQKPHDVQIASADSSSSRAGALEFVNDFPTRDTVDRMRDELKFQAAVQVYLWSMPFMAMMSLRDAHRSVGASTTTIPIFEQFLTAKTVVPTGNQATVYAYNSITLGDEPLVLEVVPDVVGFIADAWQRPVMDMGRPGPDRGEGGKYLIVPPGYEGDLPSEGYYVAEMPTQSMWWLVRAFSEDGTPEVPSAHLKGLRLYPLSAAAAQPDPDFMNGSTNPAYCIPPDGFEYWERLAEYVQHEPVQERDRAHMGMAALIGIEKGKTFVPDDALRAILTEAANVGRTMAATLSFDSEVPNARAYDDRLWEYCFLTDSPSFDAESHLELYPRTAFAFQAMTGAFAMVLQLRGKGSKYIAAFHGADGDHLDGGRNYKLNVPADVPASEFWSVAVYDPVTRSLLDNDETFSARNSKMSLDTSDDGSIDLYIGPDSPEGLENNWIRTVPGKGFFVYFRFYGPLEPYYDKSWRPGDLTPIG